MSDTDVKREILNLEPETLDADQIARCMFPQISAITWKRMDADEETPASLHLSERRRVWRVADLRLWVKLGCPDRPEFEREKKALDEYQRNRR